MFCTIITLAAVCIFTTVFTAQRLITCLSALRENANEPKRPTTEISTKTNGVMPNQDVFSSKSSLPQSIAYYMSHHANK